MMEFLRAPLELAADEITVISDLLSEYGLDLLSGVGLTIQLVLIASVIGFLLALPVSVGLASRNPVIRIPLSVYSFFFRGTPLLVQIFLIYYGLGQFEALRTSWAWAYFKEAYFCALLAFSINSAAYVAEVLRGGILGVPYGEREAAIAAGMSPYLMYRRIILPRAIRLTLPAISNEAIFTLKASSLAATITLFDLTGVAKRMFANTYQIETFLIAGVIYWLLSLVVTQGFHFLEQRYTKFHRP
jgi:putative lysine/arginine/ornithine/histidine/octopine transport system permease protein